MSFPDDLNKDASVPPTVELPIEDLLPSAEVQLAPGDGHHHLAAHDLPFVMGIAVILAGPVVEVAAGGGIAARVEGGQLLQPAEVILLEAGFLVVDEDAGGDVHGVDQAEALADAAIADGGGHFRRDVHEAGAAGEMDGEDVAMALHGRSITKNPGPGPGVPG